MAARAARVAFGSPGAACSAPHRSATAWRPVTSPGLYGYAASTTPTRAKTFTVRVLTAPSVRRGWQSAPNARRTVSRRSRSAASNSCPSASPGLSFRRAAATAATHGMTAAAALRLFF